MQEAFNLIVEQLGISKIIREEILNSVGDIVGFNAVLQNSIGGSLAGGSAVEWTTALRIGIAEGLERAIFIKLSKESNSDFKIKEFPTTCGFAAGFDSSKTKMRAICEGLERWAWSQWIDDKNRLNEQSIFNHFSRTKLMDHLLSKFDSCRTFSRNFLISVDDSKSYSLRFDVFLGYKDGGVFPGSRVCALNELSDHAVIEAYRNLVNAKIFKEFPKMLMDNNFVGKRNVYFSENAHVADQIISLSNADAWPSPIVKLLLPAETSIPGTFVWRCLFNNFLAWNLGSFDRFVY